MNLDAIRNIDRLAKLRPSCAEALNAYKDLLLMMGDEEAALPQGVMDESLKSIKRNEGFPLFSRSELPVDFNHARRLMKRFLQHAADMKGLEKDGMTASQKDIPGDQPFWEKLLKAFLSDDQKALAQSAGDLDLQVETLRFFAGLAVRPSLNLIRESLELPEVEDKWNYCHCPFCGSKPTMASLSKSGKKHLYCGTCGQQWAYPRIKCPFCENDDQESLGYFQVEKDEGYRVNFCNKCERYIKTVDKRALEETASLDIEDLATLELDLLASKEGFKGP
jgi:FdhE protein